MRIASVETIAVRLPRDLPAALGTAGTPTQTRGEGLYRWSKDYPVLYATHIETALVRVTLDSGLIGWGEAQAPLAPEVACTIIDRLLAPVLIGETFEATSGHIEHLWNRMYSTMRVRGQTGGFMLDAISGVDLALWDLAGKMQGLPVSALLSPEPRARVTAYLSGLSGNTLEERLAFAERHFREGFRHFKIYYESDWDALIALFDALRLRLGEDVEIGVDALWHLDPQRAAEQAAQLDSRRAMWLECPLMPEQIKAHAELARRIRTPLALGESYRSTWEMEPLFESGAVGWAQPDLGRAGITGSMRIAAMAAARGVSAVPHVSIALGPQVAAAVHFAAAAPNAPMCEYNPAVLTVANRFLEHPLRLEHGAWLTPTGPGLGIEMRWPG